MSKAKIIKTGEIVDVYHEPQHGQITNIYKESVFVNGRMWQENELEFIDSLQEESTSNDLEEAVNAYIGYAPEVDECSSVYGERQAFKAGAKWQKEQVMKDAFECKIDWYDGCVLGYTQEQLDNTIEALGLEVNDKIKVIIIKEE